MFVDKEYCCITEPIYSTYEDFSRDSFDDRRISRDSFDDRRPGMRGPSPTHRYAPYWENLHCF